MLSSCVLDFGLFSSLRLTAEIDRGDHKSAFPDREIQKFGRIPAKLLQAKVRIIGFRITVLDQFFASSTSSSSAWNPLSRKTSVT